MIKKSQSKALFLHSIQMLFDRRPSIDDLRNDLLRFIFGKGLFTDEEANGLLEALKLAQFAHDGQVRKRNGWGFERVPYIVHPIRVALIIFHWREALLNMGILPPFQKGQLASVIAAALLHDAVEDSKGKVKVGDVRELFKDLTADIVAALTKPSKIEADAGKLEQYYTGIENASLLIRVVKCGDRIDKLNDRALLKDCKSKRKCLDETEQAYLKIAETTDEFLLVAMQKAYNTLEAQLDLCAALEKESPCPET
jgi:(p)ppGpp synthase/HD superfamily hydrolase